jgi:hypothetical protein
MMVTGQKSLGRRHKKKTRGFCVDRENVRGFPCQGHAIQSGLTCCPQQTAMAFNTALLELLTFLQEKGYSFTCPTPETHAKVITRLRNELKGQPLLGKSLVDVWGWSLPIK